jgi:hypothetical protein
LVALEASGADFGALQILENANGTVLFFRRAAQALNVAGMIGMRTMGKIQACYIHA